MSVELLGADKAARSLGGIAHRLDDMSEVLRKQAHTLETAERGTFAELSGRYVDSGLTMRSLTLPDAPHAIRRVTSHALEFGTSVGYARYLTERIGPASAKGGAHRPPPVAVLKLSHATRQQVAHDVMDHVVDHSDGPSPAGAFLGGTL